MTQPRIQARRSICSSKSMCIFAYKLKESFLLLKSLQKQCLSFFNLPALKIFKLITFIVGEDSGIQLCHMSQESFKKHFQKPICKYTLKCTYLLPQQTHFQASGLQKCLHVCTDTLLKFLTCLSLSFTTSQLSLLPRSHMFSIRMPVI